MGKIGKVGDLVIGDVKHAEGEVRGEAGDGGKCVMGNVKLFERGERV